MKVQNFLLLLFLYFFVGVIYSCKNHEKKGTSSIPNTSKAPSKIDEPSKDSVAIDTGVCIYLTFDDGPYHTTPKLTGLLNNEGIKSSFFIVGSQVAASHFYDSIFQATKNNPLFKVYNHTFTHGVTKGRFKNYYSHPDSVWMDILHNKQYFDRSAMITRLPGLGTFKCNNYKRGCDKVSKRMIGYLDSIHSNEMLFGWDFEWTLKQSRDSAKVNQLVKKIFNCNENKKGCDRNYIVLLHDYLFPNQIALSNLNYFISELKSKLNCKFKWAEEYPKVLIKS